jgi:hypothetical protein
MLSLKISKASLGINNTIYDYCKRSTQESVKKITEKYNLERNKPKFNNPLDDDGNKKPELNLYSFLVFLSISTIGYYLYKRLH